MTDRLREPGNDRPIIQPPFDSGTFEGMVYRISEGRDDHEHNVTISFEGWYYEGALRIALCEVNLKGFEQSAFGSLEEDVTNALEYYTGKRVLLETKIEFV